MTQAKKTQKTAPIAKQIKQATTKGNVTPTRPVMELQAGFNVLRDSILQGVAAERTTTKLIRAAITKTTSARQLAIIAEIDFNFRLAMRDADIPMADNRLSAIKKAFSQASEKAGLKYTPAKVTKNKATCGKFEKLPETKEQGKTPASPDPENSGETGGSDPAPAPSLPPTFSELVTGRIMACVESSIVDWQEANPDAKQADLEKEARKILANIAKLGL